MPETKQGPAPAAPAAEPLAAVLAEFRAFALRAAGEGRTICPESVLLLADKVEAAAERERRNYQRLHECFWEPSATQSIVRQMLDEADDLRSACPKESDDLAHFAHAMIECAKPAASATGNAAAMREALEGVAENLAIHIQCGRFVAPGDHVSFPIHEADAYIRDIRAALSAPARNCDRFADVLRASEVYEATKTDLPFEEWLFSTEKGKEPENG